MPYKIHLVGWADDEGDCRNPDGTPRRNVWDAGCRLDDYLSDAWARLGRPGDCPETFASEDDLFAVRDAIRPDSDGVRPIVTLLELAD